MSSKYDRVKVRVHLGADHYYTLSRFILSKMLTFCKLPTTVAVKVSLELKKRFVDEEKLEVSQVELEAATFLIMAQYGYGEAHAKLFPVMTRFYIERVPLVVFISGSGFCGKTATAHSLGSKLNTHNVVSTDVLLEILISIRNGFPAACVSAGTDESEEVSWPQPDKSVLWLQQADTEEEFVSVWRAWSEAIRPLVEEEVNKALSEGKVLILEGSLLNLSAYGPYLLQSFQRSRGAIVIAFHIGSDDNSLQFSIERFLSSHHSLFPSFCRSDPTAAVAWMKRRLKAVEAAQNQWFTANENNSTSDMERCWIHYDGLHGNPTPLSALDAAVPNEAEETVQVHCLTYSLETLSEPPEVMQDLVLQRIMSELRHRHSVL